MCGIAGYLVQHGSARAEVVAVQLRQLRHRGPDSEGVYANGRGAIGQTRLSIIDLVTGDPPISDGSGEIGVALNGEIYNYLDLTRVLTSDGHQFATKGDTEVIAHLAEHRAPADMARRLEGMFAAAVWDSRRERLVLLRDRVGKKPLYYTTAPSGTFVFGSEIKAVTAHPDVVAALDDTAIEAFLTFGYVPSPRTFFEGIRCVPPGHVLVAAANSEPTLERYWDPAPGPVLEGITADEAADGVLSRLEDAVRRRLIADVPIGAFLSGGVDSAAIVALMSTLSSEPVRTFTIGFDESRFDERTQAATVARHFATDHTELVVRADAAALVDDLVWYHDQPFGDSSAIPTYLLAKMTSASVKVALSGDGGDEAFAGYERFNAGTAAARVERLPRRLRQLAAMTAGLVPARGRWASRVVRFGSAIGADMPDTYLSWLEVVGADDRRALLRSAPGRVLSDYRAAWATCRGATTLHQLLELNIRTYLLDDLLPKLDRMSMAHGLEVRSPFLDHAVIEFAHRLPAGHLAGGVRTKKVLKQALAELVPDEVLNRPKKGFGVPVDKWFRGSLASTSDTRLGSPTARVRKHLVGAALDALIARHGRRGGQGAALFALLTLEAFLEQRDW